MKSSPTPLVRKATLFASAAAMTVMASALSLAPANAAGPSNSGSSRGTSTPVVDAATRAALLGSCSDKAAPGDVSCLSRSKKHFGDAEVAALADRVSSEVTAAAGKTTTTTATITLSKAPYGPTDLRSMYGVPSTFTGTPTIAIVDVGHYPNAKSDLTTYRNFYKQTACTTGCFTEVNQNGEVGNYPAENAAWDGEIMLDLETVSGVCPSCKLLLVDANSASMDDMMKAVKTATDKGAQYVSMSFGSSEFSGENYYTDTYMKAPGVTYVAATGDDGYTGTGFYPAAAEGVIGAGGVSIQHVANKGTSADWTATAWSGAGSGCSAYSAMAVQQTKSAAAVAACGTSKAVSDVAGLADPNTGLAVYVNGGWWQYGGTSAAAPAIAAMYAIAGNHTNPNAVYANVVSSPASFKDVTAGSTAGCLTGGATICTAKTGWDGPTGVGVPYGTKGLTVPGASTTTTTATTATSPGSGRTH